MSNARRNLSPPSSIFNRVRRPSRGSTRPESIASTRSLGPYRELRQWDQQLEEPLIQLDPSLPSNFALAQRTEPGKPPSFNFQPSLLDLDDPIDLPVRYKSQMQVDLDRQLAERVHAEINGPDCGPLGNESTLLPEPDPQISHYPDQHICDQCEENDIELSFCNACGSNFCAKCWDSQVPHRKKRLAPGAVPHERTDYTVARKIKDILESKPSETEQEQLHKNDEDTSWFGIVREDGELPLFQDYGRYANLMASTARNQWTSISRLHSAQRDSRFPSLVSFVGQTGAGKSTLIKLVIELNTEDRENFTSPVVGVVGRDVPTSDDVHLYLDPQTSSSDTPILYADCEGLEGGERVPLGARFRKRDKSSRPARIGSFERRLRNMQHTSEREITWADSTAKRSREYAVTHLYPRLLYTFSDVIVFVLKNPRVIESVFERLVNWAAAALEKSSNQPILPHAIIALNASENDIDAELWDTETATAQLMDSLSRTVFQNATFKKCAQFWRERKKPIETVGQLLLAYYSSVQVVRIPTRGRPRLIQDQIGKLYSCVTSACTEARRSKGALRMLLDAEELQPYLQTAFDHFACNLDTPFDFVQASFTNSPIPLNFGGNILKLAINLMDVWRNKADGRTIFVELSYMVASCIMLDSARHKIRGTADQIFPQYLDHIDAALENFCDRHWPCEFIKPGGGERCVNVRSGHGSKGHQLQNGKVLAVGEYVSRFSFDNHQEEFQFDVYSRLDQLLGALAVKKQEGNVPEDQAAAEIHKDTVMTHFFEHVTQGQADKFVSHSTCFSCLFEPPEHALPCGHVLCTPCLKAYGQTKSKIVVEIRECPLEPLKRQRYQVWRVFLKPPSAGVRLLSLDGGGIRGIVILEILRQIERAMGGNIAIQSFFDLVIGTSTGGLIALGLIAKNWSVEECCTHFEELCERAFTRRLGGNMPGVNWLVESFHHSKYETHPLEDALKSAFSEEEYLFGGRRPNGLPCSDIKVGVTATSTAGSGVLLSNYNRLSTQKLPYHFQRPENVAAELKVWEAGRATSAAPRIFKPICHKPSKQVYMDGAIYNNNPVKVIEMERKLVWPNLCNEYPDILLSIGTAYSPQSRRRSTENLSSPQSGVFAHGKSLLKIAIDHIASSLDSEKAWHDYISMLPLSTSHRSRYVRLNPELAEDPPRLDEVGSLKHLQDVVRNQMIDTPQITKVARQLLATSFYFEKAEPIKFDLDGNHECQGHICCRLPQGEKEIGELGKIIRNCIRNGRDPYFLVQEESSAATTAQRIIVSPEIVQRMIREFQFRMSRITLKLSSTVTRTEIFLCLNESDCHPISGFPRSLLEDEGTSGKTRQIATANSNRWKGRTPSQQQRRKKWVAPDLTKSPERSASISRYSDNEYILGDLTADGLRKTADLLTNGPSPLRLERPRNRFFRARRDTSTRVRMGDERLVPSRHPVVRWLNGMPPPRPQPPSAEATAASSEIDADESPQYPTSFRERANTFELAGVPRYEVHGESMAVELPTSYNTTQPASPLSSPLSLYGTTADLPLPISAAANPVSHGSSPSPADPSGSPSQLPSRDRSRPNHTRDFSALSSGIELPPPVTDEEDQRRSQYLAELPSPVRGGRSPVNPDRYLNPVSMIPRGGRSGKAQSTFEEMLAEEDEHEHERVGDSPGYHPPYSHRPEQESNEDLNDSSRQNVRVGRIFTGHQPSFSTQFTPPPPTTPTLPDLSFYQDLRFEKVITGPKPPITSKNGFLGICRAARNCHIKTDMPITKGELLCILEKSSENLWCRVRKTAVDDHAPTGMLPKDYVEEAQPIHQAKALYGYTSQREDEISFPAFAVLSVYETSDKDWTLAGIDGAYGFVPASFVETLKKPRPLRKPRQVSGLPASSGEDPGPEWI